MGELGHVLRNLASEDVYPSRTVILLKSLQNHLLKASISEDTLEILEVLERHLLEGSNPITTTMKSAYCRVAVECTLKYIEAKASHPTYLQAVDGIWRGRIVAIASRGSHLFSHDLKNWKTQFENSLFDININSFVSLPEDTRMEALHKVQMFFDEAWDNFCASFLHPPAQILTHSQQRRRGSFFVVVFFDTLM
jgi:telomeric repeat-binding factor 2